MYKKFRIKTSSYSAPNKIGRPVIKGFMQLNENVTCFYQENKIAYETYLKTACQNKLRQMGRGRGTGCCQNIFLLRMQHYAHKLTMCFDFPLYNRKYGKKVLTKVTRKSKVSQQTSPGIKVVGGLKHR